MVRDDWITVQPGPEGLGALLAELSALAEHPGHIRTAGGAQEFIVPPYLAALYIKPPAPPKKRAPKPKEGDE